MALATQYNLELHQLDVQTEFLYGHLEEEIYMQIPDGLLPTPNPHLVCKLLKSLYGLKQSSRAWYTRLDQYLISQGYTRLEADASIYIKRDTSSGFIILAVYVDDCILASNKLSLIQDLKSTLHNQFEMTDDGELHYTLGNAIIRNRQEGCLIMHQEKYLLSKLKEYNMLTCNSLPTPMSPGLRLSKYNPDDNHDVAMPNPFSYSQIVGSLIHATVNTRPDCAYTVGSLAQYLSDPKYSHFQTLKRVLRYLKGTSSYGIKYQRQTKAHDLQGFSDADWAGDKDTRRSTSGYCFLLTSGVISWGSKKQTSVALSSTESEYMALAKATAEAVWLRKLLFELGFPQLSPTIIHSDSQSAIALSQNPKFHSRSKHVDTQYHFTRDKLLANEITLEHVSTVNMAADILTKSLSKDKHITCMQQLGMCSIPSPAIMPSHPIHALMTFVRPPISTLHSSHSCGSNAPSCIYCSKVYDSWSGRHMSHKDWPLSKTHSHAYTQSWLNNITKQIINSLDSHDSKTSYPLHLKATQKPPTMNVKFGNKNTYLQRNISNLHEQIIHS